MLLELRKSSDDARLNAWGGRRESLTNAYQLQRCLILGWARATRTLHYQVGDMPSKLCASVGLPLPGGRLIRQATHAPSTNNSPGRSPLRLQHLAWAIVDDWQMPDVQQSEN